MKSGHPGIFGYGSELKTTLPRQKPRVSAFRDPTGNHRLNFNEHIVHLIVIQE
jgi:hypothetical protein